VIPCRRNSRDRLCALLIPREAARDGTRAFYLQARSYTLVQVVLLVWMLPLLS
jgi:hypothetical protein